QINPKRRDDYQAIIESLGKTDKTAINVMHMWSVTPNKRGPYEASDLETSQSRGFYSLLFLAQALGAQRINCPVTMAIVSNDMQGVAGERERRFEKATILGPCRVIPQEYPDIKCRSIDILLPDSPEEKQKLIDTLLSEFSEDAPDNVVAYRGGHRWVQT